MNPNIIATLITLLLGFFVFVLLVPEDGRRLLASLYQEARASLAKNGELGGYVHDTAMSQYLPPTKWHFATATMTQVAGQVAGTIAMHRAAADQTSVITIPIMLPSNSVAGKGSMLKSIEVDYEILVAEPTSLTWTLNKVTRGADTADAVVAAVTKTNTIADAAAKTVNEHKQTITITTPAWIDNDEYYLLELSLVAGAGGNTTDFLGAVANYTLRA